MNETLDQLTNSTPGFSSVEPGVLFGNQSFAYLAGLIDGEGYVSIIKYYNNYKKKIIYSPVVRITNTNYSVIEYLNSTYKGCVSNKKKQQKHHKDCWSFDFARSTLRITLESIKEHSIVKREQMEILLEFLTTIMAVGENRNYTYAELAKKERLYIKCKKLNFRGLI